MNQRRLFLVALAAAAILVPAAASASTSRHAPRVRIALIPLQTAQLGPAGASLPLNYGSGSTSNDQSFSGNGFSLGVPGEIAGWALDYGDPSTGSTGVMEIRSSVAEYGSRRRAREGLLFGRFLDTILREAFDSPSAPTTVKKVKVAPVGQRRFGYLITSAAPNLNPLVRLDEQVAAGRFVLELSVTAGSASAAELIAPHLLRVLHRRLQLALEGGLHGTSPKLPPAPHRGQAPGGPDLSTLILQPTDVGQSHAVNLYQGYYFAPHALSDFLMLLAPAGTYAELVQQIAWWPSATEATYAEAYGGQDSLFFGSGFGGGTVTPVDLSAVGDGATGYIVQQSDQSTAHVTLTNGQAGESVVAISQSPLQASDVQSLAQAAADRLDAGLGP